MADQHVWTFSLIATLDGASRAAAWLDCVAREGGAGGDSSYALQVCLEEILANIVMHNPGRSPDVVLKLESDVTHFKLVIEDTGAPFDTAAAKPQRAAGALDALEPGGLGIQLIQSFSSDLQYSRQHGTNKLVVVVPKTTTGSD